MEYDSVCTDTYFNIERKAITKAIRTSSSAARSSSHSTQSAPKKPSSAQRSGSTQRASTPTQSRQTSSAPRCDTFTYSSPTAKQTAPKTSTAKTSTASKSSQSKTSTTKTNTAAKTSTAKTATTTKSTSAASNKNRDTFTYTSPAAKTAVKLTQKGTVSAQKNTKVNQTKTAVKNYASNKIAVSGSLSKNKTASSKTEMLESMKKQYEKTKDPKQKAAMLKTMNDIAYGLSSKKTNKTTDILVKYDRSKIKSQFEYYKGYGACYATSADNMWRVNDGAVGNRIINLNDANKDYGTLFGEIYINTTYTDDMGNEYAAKEYTGVDNTGNKYSAIRLQNLSTEQYNNLVLQELNKNKIVCVRVTTDPPYNQKGQPIDQDIVNHGHTLNIVGVDSSGNYLYEDVGRYPEVLKDRNPVTLSETSYNTTKYFEVQSGKCELWIDTTVKKRKW